MKCALLTPYEMYTFASYLLQGNFTVTAHVILDNVTVLGAGRWFSSIHGDGVGFYGNMPPTGSSNVQVRLCSLSIK